MEIEKFELGPVMTNAYLVYDETKGTGVVIDPGMNPDRLIDRISDLKLKIEAILLTHAHLDHIGGLEEVRTRFKAPVYIHELEQSWLSEPKLNGSAFFPGFTPIVCKPAENTLTGTETLSLLDEQIQVLHTPGHTPGSVTFYWDGLAFSGDALFQNSIGRTDLPGGDYDILMKSIRNTLMEMPDETRVLSGHGPETTIGRERVHNPFVTGM
ncbi:MBL fold metallo-hydrolase [Hazenella sp. IB182353]|uniref:MBL fold metallo-hydrolase n=1 Tax=Polycladospora coralii TaxID=2771432 RepID=UPI0017471659|nr:MBL fold metallo-hydrolase [Polycladospora coralii]MBS7530252.1 MBL fold metallo-hydrolase [Polycladospora coralii]